MRPPPTICSIRSAMREPYGAASRTASGGQARWSAASMGEMLVAHATNSLESPLSATLSPVSAAPSDIALRPVRPHDADAVARILHGAFAGIHDHHRFPRDFPTPESAAGLVAAFIGHPSIWGVVAERDG